MKKETLATGGAIALLAAPIAYPYFLNSVL